MNGSRFLDTASTKLILLAAFWAVPPKMPTATSLAISTSNPSTWPVVGFFNPKPGWSNLVPTVSLPLAWMAAMVVPAANLGAAAVVAVVLFFLLLPQAAETTASRTRRITIARDRVLMGAPFSGRGPWTRNRGLDRCLGGRRRRREGQPRRCGRRP